MLEQRSCLETIDLGQRQRSGLNKTDGLSGQRTRRKLDIYALIATFLKIQVQLIICHLLRLRGQEFEQFDLLLLQAKPIIVTVYQTGQGLIYQLLPTNLPLPH